MFNIKQSLETGLSFGLTSAVITTLGLIVGLSSGTSSRNVVLGGILVIAIADSFSDALGIHVSEESDRKRSKREVWESTFSALFSKLFFALSFALPVLIFSLSLAVMINIFWGALLIGVFSYYIARQQQHSAFKITTEHLTIAAVVVLLTHLAGRLAANFG